MSDIEYCKMLEIPVNSCDVVIKNSKRKKKDVVNKVIKKVNLDSEKLEQSKTPPATQTKSVIKKQVDSKLDVISVQVVAIFALVVGIVLTNIFWEDSGMNNLLKQVFNTQAVTQNDAVYTSFDAVSPSKTNDVILENGVMKVSSGAIYSPCDGIVESVTSEDGVYTLTIKHSDSFSTVISGLSLCYASVNDTVYSTVPIGYSESEMSVCMFNSDAILTSFTLNGNDIVWIN